MTKRASSNLSSDKRWGLFNQSLQEYIKANDFWALGSTYYEMANFLKGEGKNDTRLRKLGHNMKLKVNESNLNDIEKSDVVSKVEVIACSDSCDLCKELNGKYFSINVAKKTKLLPVKECSYESGCRCVYAPTVE